MPLQENDFDLWIQETLEHLHRWWESQTLVGWQISAEPAAHALEITLEKESSGIVLVYLFSAHTLLKQLWVSSPLVGGKKFGLELPLNAFSAEHLLKNWKNLRTQEPLEVFLHHELARAQERK